MPTELSLASAYRQTLNNAEAESICTSKHINTLPSKLFSKCDFLTYFIKVGGSGLT